MASVNPKAIEVFETDGLAGDYAQPGGGVLNSATVANNPTETRSKTAKDFIDVQRVLHGSIGGTGAMDIRVSTPESA